MRMRLLTLPKWIWSHPKDAIIIILTGLLLAALWPIKRDATRDLYPAQARADMPTDSKHFVTVYRDRVITRWREGPTKVVYRDQYIPHEGNLSVDFKEASSAIPIVTIKTRGLTRRLGLGFVYSSKVLPQPDLKWFFAGRYGLTTGLNPEYAGFGISRHIDDFTPFRNVEALANVGLSWEGDLRVGLGLRSNL